MQGLFCNLRRMHRRLTEAGVVCALRGGGVRLSPHFYTPYEQFDVALASAGA